MNSWAVGSRVTLSLRLTNPKTGLALDPLNPVQLNYQIPGQAITRLTYGVAAALEKDGVGLYHIDLDCEVAGIWNYRFFAPVGAGQFAVEGQFQIMPTLLL